MALFSRAPHSPGVRARDYVLSDALVAAGSSPQVTSVEVRDQVAGTGGSGDHLFRVVT